jgi:hypothetical protein
MSSFVLPFTRFYAICPPFQEVLSGNPKLLDICTKKLNFEGCTKISLHTVLTWSDAFFSRIMFFLFAKWAKTIF